MEEEDTKQCPNCKREIPSINFMTHSVHCARNVRTCPVCKEPVPVAQLQEHHDALHKEVPCKKCGESVCGTDLEDHIRDSCAQTIKPCRYCELELPRHALPAHESYCGARSEQCPECREYVMIKYRQLHLDSNHGFIRLEEDPVPKEAKPKPTTNGFSNPSTSRQNGLRADNPRPRTEIRYNAGSSNIDRVANRAASIVDRVANDRGVSNVDRVVNNDRLNNLDRVERNGKITVKRTNDQPQINTSMESREKVQKDLPSRGAVKKRPAPPPPAPAPPPPAPAPPPPAPAPHPRRDLPYWSATKRAQDEERKRQEQTAYNLSVGLPPVLSPAAKLEKLRKMDALHNREIEEDYSHRLRGRTPPEPEPTGHRLDDLSNLRPMTAQQFMDRFQELQLGGALCPAVVTAPAAPRAANARAAGADRFSEIKSSLRELRRGLNEVTAPYNSASNATNNTQIDSNRLSPEPMGGAGDGGEEWRLPCEFCGAAVLADELVLHQTGCRPDLAQYRPSKPSRSHSPRARSRSPSHTDEPVIPCEFCTESLPVYLISEHQERCRRDANILYPD